MDTLELISSVARRCGDTRAIYTGTGNPEDRYAIVKAGARWVVYYTERGAKHDVRDFSSESLACEYLLGVLNDDSTIWR